MLNSQTLSCLDHDADPSCKMLACEVAMLAQMAKSDGHVSKQEVAFLNEVIDRSDGDASSKQFLQQFANEQKANVDNIIDFAVAAAKSAAIISPEDCGFRLCLSAYYDLFCMALADGEISSQEILILRSIPESLGLSNDSFDVVGKYLSEGNSAADHKAFLSLLQGDHNQFAALSNRGADSKFRCRVKARELCKLARSLRTQSAISTEEVTRIQIETAALESRIADKNLYLGIVGEFSTGKSTFINALLGFELLKEDVLQGTTCVPTLLAKGDSFSITVNFQNGRQPVRYPACNAFDESSWSVGADVAHALKCIRDASGFLNRYTAEEEVSKTVLNVCIEIPGDYWHLPSNIVVVDTPGLNADNSRHGMVTRESIRNVCDLCCVLTSASIPCPSSLVNFVSENLREMQDRCVCVVTQVDRVSKRERDGLVNYISERLSSEGMSFKKVFGVAPIYAAHREEQHVEAESFRASFSDFTRSLSSMLEEARNDVISEKTERLTHHLADETLRPLLESILDEYNRRKEALASNKLAEPDSFFTEAKCNAGDAMRRAKDQGKLMGENSLNKTIDEIKESVEREINNADSVDKIRMALSGSLTSRLNGPMRDALQKYSEQCIKAMQLFLERFKREFNVAYRNLCRDAPAFPTLKGPEVVVCLPQMDFSGVVGAINVLDIEDDEQRLGNAAKGAAAGAVVGTVVPVIGTVVGGIAGGIIGVIFGGKDVAEFRDTAKSKLANGVKDLREKVLQYFDQESKLDYGQIVKELDEQLDFYRKQTPAIRSVIQKEEAEINRIDRIVSDAKADLCSLTPFLNPL